MQQEIEAPPFAERSVMELCREALSGRAAYQGTTDLKYLLVPYMLAEAGDGNFCSGKALFSKRILQSHGFVVG